MTHARAVTAELGILCEQEILPSRSMALVRPERRIRAEKVLIVEDSPGDRVLLQESLRDIGYGVLFADGASAAILEIARGVAAVVVDWVLPIGWGAPVTIFEAARLRSIPACVYSGYRRDPSSRAIWIPKNHPGRLLSWLQAVAPIRPGADIRLDKTRSAI